MDLSLDVIHCMYSKPFKHRQGIHKFSFHFHFVSLSTLLISGLLPRIYKMFSLAFLDPFRRPIQMRNKCEIHFPPSVISKGVSEEPSSLDLHLCCLSLCTFGLLLDLAILIYKMGCKSLSQGYYAGDTGCTLM